MRSGNWLRTRIRTHLAYWTPRLALAGWRIHVRWRPDGDMAGNAWGEFNALAVYYRRRMEAVLYFNLPMIAKDSANDRVVEELVVHELLHVLLGLNEVQTNTLARALVRERRGE